MSLTKEWWTSTKLTAYFVITMAIYVNQYPKGLATLGLCVTKFRKIIFRCRMLDQKGSNNLRWSHILSDHLVPGTRAVVQFKLVPGTRVVLQFKLVLVPVFIIIAYLNWYWYLVWIFLALSNWYWYLFWNMLYS